MSRIEVPPALVASTRPKKLIQNKENQSDVVIDDTKPNELLFFQNCTNSHFTVRGKLAKIIIEVSKDCHFVIEAITMTGTVEIINSNNVTVNLATEIGTITVDKTTGVNLSVTNSKKNWNTKTSALWTNKANDITLSLHAPFPQQIQNFGHSADCISHNVNVNGNDIDQFKTHLQSGNFSTEMVVREGAGYATTEREKRENDERDTRNQIIYQQLLYGSSAPTPTPTTPASGMDDVE